MDELIEAINGLTNALSDTHSIWTILSTIATVIATVTALYLSVNPRKRKLNIVFYYKSYTDDTPKVIVTNVGNKVIIINSISLYGENWGYQENFIDEDFTGNIRNITLAPGQREVVELDATRLWHDYSHAPFTLKRETEKVKILIIDAEGKKYRTKTNYLTKNLFSQVEGIMIRRAEEMSHEN